MNVNKLMNNNDYYYIGLLVLANALLFQRGDVAVGLFFAAVSIGMVVFILSRAAYRKRRLEEFIAETISKLTTSVAKAVEESEVPVVVLRPNGEAMWFNHAAEQQLFQKDSGYNMGKLLGAETLALMEKKETVETEIRLGERYYHMGIIPVESAKHDYHADLRILLFNDVTQVRKAEEHIDVVMLLEVDNHSELVSKLENDTKLFLMAELEKVINSYAHEMKALIRKYDNHRFLLSTSDRQLKEEIQKKFPILERIKQIQKGNTMEPTLSIGIGRYGHSAEENQQLASAAKELALGRGGDQVVIKTPDGLSFFGGSSKEVEKQSRVRSRVVAHALRDLMRDSREIFVMGHKNPDMDCIGAALGMEYLAEVLGKKAYILLEEPYESIRPILAKLETEPRYDKTFIDSATLINRVSKEDVLIVVDVHSLSYVQNPEILEHFKKVVVIDHHRRAPDQISGVTLTYIENYASSTSELVTEIIQYTMEKPKLSTLVSEALFAGISVDTKSFIFKTGVRTFDAASFLKMQGASTLAVRELFATDFESFRKKSLIINDVEMWNGIAIAKAGDTEDLLISAQAADDLAGFKEVVASFVLTKNRGDIVISARSLKDLNVQLILEELGGGGHMTMAGARLKNATFEEAQTQLTAAIEKYRKEGNS